MTVHAVGFVPAAPLLVPQIAGGSAHLDAKLRSDCVDVVRDLVADDPDDVLVVAATSQPGLWPEGCGWNFDGFGVHAPATPPAPGSHILPWPLGLGAWWLHEAGWHGARRYVGVTAEEAAPVGTPTGSATVVLAVGDGSACRTERAPGHLHPRAEEFDTSIAAALAAGDADRLGGLDESLARDLLCPSLPVWRYVAAALDRRPVARSELRAHSAPYGVGYFAALWRLD